MPAGAIPFPFGKCRICNDKATGVHYGIATCEGCKGFFKRSTTKGEKYKCFFGSQCLITPQNRNRCKACRYQKCLDNGMSMDGVKMGRIPKVDKEKALEAERQRQMIDSQRGMQQNTVAPPTSCESPNLNNFTSLSIGHRSAYDSIPHNEGPTQAPSGGHSGYPFAGKEIGMSMLAAGIGQNSDKNMLAPINDGYRPNSVLSNNLTDNQKNTNDDVMKNLMMHLKNSNDANDPNQQPQLVNVASGGISQRGDMVGGSTVENNGEWQGQTFAELTNVGQMRKRPAGPVGNGVGEEEHQRLEKRSNSSYDMESQYRTVGLLGEYLNQSQYPMEEEQAISNTAGTLDNYNTPSYTKNDHNVTQQHPPQSVASGDANNTLSKDTYLKDEFDRYLEAEAKTQEKANVEEEIVLGSTDEDYEKTAIAIENAFQARRNALLPQYDKMELYCADQSRPLYFDLGEINIENELVYWQQLILSIDPTTAQITELFKGIPKISHIKEGDREVLLKAAYFDIWVITSAGLFWKGNTYLLLPNGLCYSRRWMEHFIKQDLTEQMHSFARDLNKCRLTGTEVALLSSVQATCPDFEGLEDVETIREINNHLLDVFAYMVTKNHPQNSARILIDIFRIIPNLRNLQKLYKDIILNFVVSRPPGALPMVVNAGADSSTDKRDFNDLKPVSFNNAQEQDEEERMDIGGGGGGGTRSSNQ